MEKLVELKLDRLIDLFKQISMEFKWQQPLINHFAALTYTVNKKDFDKVKIKDVRDYIKKTTGIFSSYRGAQLMMLSSLLASKYNFPIREFDKIHNYHRRMKDVGFKNSIYLPIANYILLDTCKEQYVDMRISKAIIIYKEMKKKHRWLTSGEDYPLSILLANSNDSVDKTIESMEECSKLLNENGFEKNNGVQFLSYILGFSHEDNIVKVLRCKKAFIVLKDNKIKVYAGNYAIIGLLSIIDEEGHEAIDQVIKVVEILKSNKKYKWLTKQTYLYTAAFLVCNVYIEKIKNKKKQIHMDGKKISIDNLISAQIVATIAQANGVTKLSKGNG